MTRHVPIQDRQKMAYDTWLADVAYLAITEAEHTIDANASFWRECFNDGMSPHQALEESFTEQDGL